MEPTLSILVFLCGTAFVAAAPVQLSLRRSGLNAELSWPGTIDAKDGSKVRPYFELQRSINLSKWEPYGERLHAAGVIPGEVLSVNLPSGEPHWFQPGISALALGGADVFGYSDAFARELARIGQITPEEFAQALSPEGSYLERLSWDPTTARFWTEFNIDPAQINIQNNEKRGFREMDYRLDPVETALYCCELLCLDRCKSGFGLGGPIRFSGWYPKLFYRPIYSYRPSNGPLLVGGDTFDQTYGPGAFDAILAEVHTDVPCAECGDPGSVLHEAVRRANLLMIAVENGGDRFICAGPILSHYEFEISGAPRRLSDDESLPWVDRWGPIQNYPLDLSPEQVEGIVPPLWTKGYRVPAF